MNFISSLLFSLLLSIVFLLLSLKTWINEDTFTTKITVLSFFLFSLFLSIKTLKSYSKVQLDRKKKTLTVKKIFRTSYFKFESLTRWQDISNSYRIPYTRLKLKFDSKEIDIFDHVDPMGVSDLHHFLKHNYHHLELKNT